MDYIFILSRLAGLGAGVLVVVHSNNSDHLRSSLYGVITQAYSAYIAERGSG